MFDCCSVRFHSSIELFAIALFSCETAQLDHLIHKADLGNVIQRPLSSESSTTVTLALRTMPHKNMKMNHFFYFHHKNVTVCLPNRRLCHCGCLCVSGEPVPRSLEGLFVYEERSTSPPANDTIVVEQWTVIEVSETFGEMFVEQRCFIHSLLSKGKLRLNCKA